MAKKKTLYKADFSNSKQRAAEYAEAYRQKRSENKSFVEPLAKNKDYRTQQARQFAELSGANPTTDKNKTGREVVTPESWAGKQITVNNNLTTRRNTSNNRTPEPAPNAIHNFANSRQMANTFANRFRDQRSGKAETGITSLYDLARQTVEDQEKERKRKTGEILGRLGLKGTPVSEKGLLNAIKKNNSLYEENERKTRDFNRAGLRSLVTNRAEKQNEARRVAAEMYEENTPPLRRLVNAQTARSAQARNAAQQIMKENLQKDKTLGQYKTTATGKKPKMDWQSSFYTDTGFEDTLYDYINRNEEARSRQRLNDAKFGTTHDQYDNLDDETIREFNYIYEKSPENAYKYLDAKVGKNYTGQEAFITSLMNATGAPSISAAAAKGMAKLTGDREAERRNREWYGNLLRDTQAAAEQHPYASGAGSIAGTVALISAISSGAGAVSGTSGAFANLPGIARTMLNGAAVMGGATAIQQGGAAATGFLPTGEYARNVAISSAGGAAGAAVGSAVGAKVGQIAGNVLRGSKLAENQLARTLTAALVAGMSASGYSLGNTGVSETASYLRDPKNYKPDMKRITKDALTAFAFGMFSYASRAGRTEGQAAPQEEFRSEFFDDCSSPQEARAKLRQYSKQYHPDLPTGDADMMARINADYAGWMNNWNATRGMEAYTRAQQAAETGNSQEYAAAKREFDECVNALVLQTQSANATAEAVEAAQILQVMSEEMSMPAGNGSVMLPAMADDVPQQDARTQIADLTRADNTSMEESLEQVRQMTEEAQGNAETAISTIEEQDAYPEIPQDRRFNPAEAMMPAPEDIYITPDGREGREEEQLYNLAQQMHDEKEEQRLALQEAGRNRDANFQELMDNATMLSEAEKREALIQGSEERRLKEVMDARAGSKSRVITKNTPMPERINRLMNYIKRVVKGDKTKRFEIVDPDVEGKFAEDISTAVGFDVSGYEVRIAGDEIRHLVNRHGKNGVVDRSLDDIDKLAFLPELKDKYTGVKPLTKENEKYKNRDGTYSKTVGITVELEDGKYLVVEAVPDSEARAINVISVYRTEKAASVVPDVTNPRQTANTELQYAANDIITSQQDGINGNTSDEYWDYLNVSSENETREIGYGEELTEPGDYLPGEGRGRNVPLRTGESDGRIPSETGVSAETSRSLTEHAADREAGSVRILRRSKAEDLIPTAEEGQEVYLIEGEKTTTMKRGEAIVMKAGATKVTSFASDAPIRVKTGEEVRAWTDPKTLEVGYRANDEDADGEKQLKHEAAEIGILTGKINVKDAAEHIRTAMADMGLEEYGINVNDEIDSIISLYAQGIDLDDPRIPSQVKVQRLKNATKEMVCDAAAGINQFEGVAGYEDLASIMDLMTTVADPYINEKLDYAFDEAMNFPDQEPEEMGTKIEVTSADGKVNADFAQPTIIEKPNEEGHQYSSTLYWNPSRKERITIDGKGNRKIVSAEEKSGREYLIEMMEKNKTPEAERKKTLEWLDKTARFMDRAEAVYTFIGLDDIRNAKIVINPRSGNIVLKALVKNGEYPVNIDLTKECKSRIAFGKYIDYLVKSKGQQGGKNMLEEVPLTASNLVRVNQILKEEGFDTACLGCFVETKRGRIKEWAQSYVDKYNAIVDKVNPDAEYFDFTDKDVYITDLTGEDIDELTDDLEAYKAEKTRALEEKRTSTGNKRTGLTNEEDIEALVRSGKSYQKKLRISDLISAEGRTVLHRDYPELESLILNHYGSATPKSIELFTPYNYELGSIEKISGKKLADYLVPVGGGREQSFSDFIITHTMDMMEKTADMAINKLRGQIYSKVPAGVLLFGQTKRKYNMSIMFNIDPDVSAGRAGLKQDGSYFVGDRETSEKEARGGRERTFVQSFPYAMAKKIQNTPGYSENCGMIGVGMSYWHNIKMLDDPDFDYIIGYHLSSMTKELAEMSHINMATDYTNVQNTLKAVGLRKVIGDYDGIPSYASWPQGVKTIENGYIAKEKPDLALDDFDFKGNLKKYGPQQTMKMFLDWMQENSLTLETKKVAGGVGDFPLYRDLEKTKDPKKTADNYIAWCLEKGYIPEFYEFAGHDNYYNFLYDFSTHDHLTGEYSPQVPVEMRFPKNFWKIANKAMNQYNNYSERQGAKERETFEKMYRDATGFKGEFRYSSKLKLNQNDKKYLKALESGDLETAKEMVSEAAKKAGYTENLYHGTAAFGFTKFDISKMDDKASIFATSDPKVAESYSGETKRTKIYQRQGRSDDEIIDRIDSMGDEDLLPLIKEHIDKKYEQVPAEKLQEMRAERVTDIRYYADRVMDYVDKETDEAKKTAASRLASSMYKIARAKNADDVDDYKTDYNNDAWEMKWLDEDAFYDMFDGGKGVTTTGLAIQEFGRLMESDTMFTNGEKVAGSTLEIFTPGEARTELIGTLSKGIYHLYGKKENMLEFDAGGDNWNFINTTKIPNMKFRIKGASGVQTKGAMYTFDEAQKLAAESTRRKNGQDDFIAPEDVRDELGILRGWKFSSKKTGEPILELESLLSKRVNTRTISEYARNAGYDGVIMRNLKDSGGVTPYNQPSDVYIYFKSDAVKSADEVTYNDNGEVIPLGERFNSKKDDLRYSYKLPLTMEEVQTAREITREKEKYINGLEAYKTKVKDREFRRNQAQKLLRKARQLQSMAKKGSPEFQEQVQALIGGLDTVSAGMRKSTRESLQALWDEVNAQAALDPDYAKYHATKYADVFKRLSTKQIRDMSLLEIAELTEQIIALETSKKNFDREIRKENARKLSAVANMAIVQQEHIKSLKDKNEIAAFFTKYGLNMLNPVRAMAMLDGYQIDGVFTGYGKELNDGQTEAARFKMKVDKMFQEIDNNPNLVNDFAKQNIEIKTLEGTVKISKGMRISLYLMLGNTKDVRHPSDNIRHIALGGITIPDESLYRKGKYKEAYTAGKIVHFAPWNEYADENTAKAIKKIVADMTPEEKEYAEICKVFFNKVCKDAINEVSMQLDGYARAIVDDYFPIKSDKDFLQKNMEGLVMDATIEGLPMLKERTGGRNTVLLEDASQVVLRQKNNTAVYYGLAIPVRNFTRFYNYTTSDPTGLGTRSVNSVQKAVGRTWLSAGQNYIEHVIEDLQFGRQTKSSPLDAFKSLYAGTTLNLNLGVSIKQSASYPFAASVIGWKPLIKAAGKVFKKADWDYMDKITPWGYMRREGFSGTEMGEVAKQRTGIDNNQKWQKLKTSLDLIRRVDVKTTDTLFFATEEYIKEKYPNLEVRGEEYSEKLAEVYNEVLQRTQPSYDVMQRNEFLRSQNDMVKVFGMFKTQTFNMGGELIDAGLRWKTHAEYARKYGTYKEEAERSKKAFMKTVAATLASQLMLSVLTAVAGIVMRDKVKNYRDKKGEITPESLAGRVLLDFAGSFAGMTLFGGEIQSLAQAFIGDNKYYDLSYPGLDVLNETMTAMVELEKEVEKAITKKDQTGIDEIADKTANFLFQALRLKKVPAKNIYKIINAAYLWGQDLIDDERLLENGKGLPGLPDTSITKDEYAERAAAAYRAGNNEAGDKWAERTTEKKLQKAMYGDKGIDEDSSKAMVEYVKAGGDAADFEKGKSLGKELEGKELSGDERIAYVVQSKDYSAEEKVAWLRNDLDRVESKKFKAWKDAGGTDYDYMKYISDMSQWNGLPTDEKRKKIISYIKKQTSNREKQKMIWGLVYNIDSTKDGKTVKDGNFKKYFD